MKRVLIVSYYFAPLNIMASKRYGYMCQYFCKNGYEPIVLTGFARPDTYINAKMDLPVLIDEKNVIRIGMVGIKYPIKNFIMTLVFDWMKKNHKRSRILEEDSYGWFYKVKNDINFDELQDIDIVVGTFPSISNVLVAKYIAKKMKVPYIVDIRDLISDYEEGMDRNKIDRRIELYLEKKLIKRASGIIAVTRGFSRILSNRYKRKKVETIYNGWNNLNVRDGIQNQKDYLYYAGSLYEHRVESLKLLVNVIKDRQLDIKLIIRSVGPDPLTVELRKYVTALQLDDKVIIKEAVDEETIKEEQKQARINLVVSSIHKEDLALMTTLPGKIFELINEIPPILAITDKSSEIGDVLDITNKGIATCDMTEIEKFITNEYMLYKGNEKIKDFSRETQAHKFCLFLDNIIKETS